MGYTVGDANANEKSIMTSKAATDPFDLVAYDEFPELFNMDESTVLDSIAGMNINETRTFIKNNYDLDEVYDVISHPDVARKLGMTEDQVTALRGFNKHYDETMQKNLKLHIERGGSPESFEYDRTRRWGGFQSRGQSTMQILDSYRRDFLVGVGFGDDTVETYQVNDWSGQHTMYPTNRGYFNMDDWGKHKVNKDKEPSAPQARKRQVRDSEEMNP